MSDEIEGECENNKLIDVFDEKIIHVDDLLKCCVVEKINMIKTYIIDHYEENYKIFIIPKEIYNHEYFIQFQKKLQHQGYYVERNDNKIGIIWNEAGYNNKKNKAKEENIEKQEKSYLKHVKKERKECVKNCKLSIAAIITATLITVIIFMLPIV